MWFPPEERGSGSPGLTAGEYVGEAPLGQRAEERIPGQLRARRGRARDASEEARLLPRGAERVGMVVTWRVEFRLVLIGGSGSALGTAWTSGEAVAAVPARLGARLAEVADEGSHLAAVSGDERQDALDPARLGAFPARKRRGRSAVRVWLNHRVRTCRVGREMRWWCGLGVVQAAR